MTDVTMPRLADSMEQGTILRWLKRDGDSVAPDEDLVEIETDKATVTHAAEAAGTLKIVAAQGSTVPVGAVIARLAAVGERNGSEPAPAPAGTEPAPAPEQGELAPAAEGELAPVSLNGPLATPLARRAAKAHGIELERVSGSGPRGRITRADVLRAAGVAPAAAAPHTALTAERVPAAQSTAPAPAPTAEREAEGFEVREPSRIERVIARRMAEAKATIPDFEVQLDVVADPVYAIRSELKQLPDEDGVPSVNDFVLKACAIALRRHPRVNASFADGQFRLYRRVNVGVAVASDDALIVPTIHDADRKSLGEIATEARRLAARVRSGEITPRELSGGTFTVSNLGMFGMTAIRPVIHPPQAAILGVGATREVLARIDGQIVDQRLMTLTLTADHRIVYGAHAARFLTDVKALLETPLRLLL